MPELPEVETVRRGVADWVNSRTIHQVDVLHPRAVRRHLAGPLDFCHRLRDVKITDTKRRGKYLWLALDSGDALLCHLGMSGQLLIQEPQSPTGKHLRVRFQFSDAKQQLHFIDQRTFGEMLLSADGAILPAEIAHIALDVYDPQFDIAWLQKRLRKRRSHVKRALLDQSLISGVGNIYADEALWRARLHPEHPTDALTDETIEELTGHIRQVFDAALKAGGTSFDALYVNTNGESGYFERSLAAYGQQDRPCTRCGELIRRIKFTNRSSFYCPQCQKLPA